METLQQVDQDARAAPPEINKQLTLNEAKPFAKDQPGYDAAAVASKGMALEPQPSVGIAPQEVRAPAKDSEAYLAWRAATDLRGPYRVAPELLKGTRKDRGPEFDQGDTPLIVFINAKSGGRVGPRLAQVLSRALGTSQVFDLSENNPERVLRALWRNLEEQEAAGSAYASLVRSRLRILVCGGDGTVAWVFKVISDLGITPPPPVAIMPLGTGNDLSRSFRWGPAFMNSWINGHAGVYSTLKRIADAEVGELDSWQLRVTVPGEGHEMPHTYALARVDAAQGGAPSSYATQHGQLGGGGGGGGGSAAPTSAPASVAGAAYAASDAGAPAGGAAGALGGGAGGGASIAGPDQDSVQATLGSVLGSGPSSASMGGGASAAGGPASSAAGGGGVAGSPGGALAYQGRFFNYFSIGGDAQAAFGFHSLRERRPSWAGSRVANQFWYSWFSCSSGWFCNAIPSVSRFSNVEVLRGGEWRPLAVPPAVKALVVVNLQSYGGGRNIWGDKMKPEKARRQGFVQPSVDDGMIEIVGFTHGWQAMSVMITQARATHAKRLGQAAGIRMTLKGSSPDGALQAVYMQLDGEPWRQPVPSGANDPPVVVEVSLAGRARVLTNVSGGSGGGAGGARSSGGGARASGGGGGGRRPKMADVLPAGKDKGAYLDGDAAAERAAAQGRQAAAAAAAAASAAAAMADLRADVGIDAAR